jgi:hypothetical protein
MEIMNELVTSVSDTDGNTYVDLNSVWHSDTAPSEGNRVTVTFDHPYMGSVRVRTPGSMNVVTFDTPCMSASVDVLESGCAVDVSVRAAH